MQLLVEAALRGIVDFRQARLRDPWWHRRLYLLLLGYVQQLSREQGERSEDYFWLRGVLQTIAQPQSAGKILEILTDQRDRLRQSRNPFAQSQEATRPAKLVEAEQAREAWKQAFGDPADPAVQAKIQQTVQAMLADTKAGQ